MQARPVAERWRIAALWTCLAVFVLRVLGQLEVLLLAPSLLPPFGAWESGLVPYVLLLPLQILLIAALTVMAVDHGRGGGFFWVSGDSTRLRLRLCAAIYAAVMAVRLAVTALLPPHTLLARGLIPICAHWDLALFMVLLSYAPARAAEPPMSAAHPGIRI